MPAPVYRKTATPAPAAPAPAPIKVPRTNTTAFTSEKGIPQLTDTTPMLFGAHHDVPMQDVPARYLLYLWNDGYRLATNEDSKRGAVARYIKANLDALSQEDPDTIVNRG